MLAAFNPLSVNIIVYNERLAIALGFVTLAFTLVTLLSCRSFSSLLSRLGVKDPVENRIYRGFFKYHSFYWWGLIFSLILHVLVSVMHIGFNDPADLDAYLHPLIFSAGLAALVLILVIYASCRSFAGLLSFITGKSPLSGKGFTFLYRFHSYYWILLLAAVIVHFTLGYLHTGVWAY